MLYYKNDTYINHYLYDEQGRLTSPENGIPVKLLSDEIIEDLTDQYNGHVALNAEARALYQAQLIVNFGEPETQQLQDTYDENGNVTGQENTPDWQRYIDATNVVDNASDIVGALVLVRSGRPESVLDFVDDVEVVNNQEELDEWDNAQAIVLEQNTVEYPNIPNADLELKRANQNVSRASAKRALLDFGILDSVEPAINSLPEPTKRHALIQWNDSGRFRRSSHLVLGLASSMNLTTEDLDGLFAQAEAYDSE